MPRGPLIFLAHVTFPYHSSLFSHYADFLSRMKRDSRSRVFFSLSQCHTHNNKIKTMMAYLSVFSESSIPAFFFLGSSTFILY